MFRQIRSKTRFSNWVDLKKDWVALKNSQSSFCLAGSVLHRSHFFYYDKSRNGKRYPFANVNSFWYRMWKTFCHLDRANSIETNLRTCNLRTCQFISYNLRSILIEIALSIWQKVFLIKHKKITFANGYLLPFQLLS